MFQCAANLSEGRNPELLSSVREAMEAVPGVALADLSMDPDHHRMVASLLGSAKSLSQAVLRLFEIAEHSIDLSKHSGVHPRIGAVDVVPFVPLGSTTMEAAQQLALTTAEQVATRFQLPVLLYEHSARNPAHRNLPDLRRQGLQERLLENPPDFGPVQLHPRLGATVMGARRPLVAFNVVLESQDLVLAREIAKHLRSLPSVRSLGLWLESQRRVQVSINLTDPEQIDLEEVYTHVCDQASLRGVEVHSSELIGMAPATSFLKMARRRLKMVTIQPGQLLEWNFLHQESLYER
ncbi:glutamate formimidoyltransferase [bacterium]|nr:glutamate formimidoyltransferase [bacterium]